MRRYLVATLFFLALLAAWQGMVMSGRWSPVLLPSPESVGAYLWSSLRDAWLPSFLKRQMRSQMRS